MSVDRFPLRLGYLTAIAFTVLLLCAVMIPRLVGGLDPYAYALLLDQDLLVAPLFVLACVAVAPSLAKRETMPSSGRIESQVIPLCVIAALICWAGHYVVFRGLDLTRDEQMVLFDAGIFRDLSLAWPIPVEWRSLADALNRKFMLPIGASEAWVSAYLPVNAAFHAAVGAIIDDDLTAPLFVATGGFFLWRITRQLWPDDGGARVATILLYFTSAQVLVTGMTKYSMSAHMALNLIWLWLFLRNRWSSHAWAMAVAFLATGLHQPIFHPLFALPFIQLLVARREWRPFLAYCAIYGLILVFWFAWPLMIASMGAGPVAPTTSLQTADFLQRLGGLVGGLSIEGFWLTCTNLVRFITWQHLLLLPLAVLGSVSFWRSEPLVRALIASLVLPVIVLWVVLPWQGNGWGYRYLQPAIGSAMLLGGWGWQSLTERGLTISKRLAWATGVALVLLLPLRALMVYQSTREFAVSEMTIATRHSDLAIIDGKDTEFVLNRHDLSNRPIRLIAQQIPLDAIGPLCRNRSVVFVDGAAPRSVSAWQKGLRQRAIGSGCQVQTVTVWMGSRRWRPSLSLQ